MGDETKVAIFDHHGEYFSNDNKILLYWITGAYLGFVCGMAMTTSCYDI